MLYNNCIEELTGLKDIIVKEVKNIYGEQHLYAKMHKRIHTCPKCGGKTSKVHDYREQIIKDLSSFGQITYIHLNKRRHVCPICGKRFCEEIDFLPRYHRMTNRLYAYLTEQFLDISSIKHISRKNNVSSTTTMRIFDMIEYPKPNLPEVLSIDEFRGNAGGEKFQCILTDPQHKRVLDILPERKSESLYAYFSSFDKAEREKVKYISIDMSTLFRSVVKTCFPKAKIIADKYHVVRQVTWALDRVRKEEQKKFSKNRRLHFKHSRQILLKPSQRLTTYEKEQLSVMLQASDRIREAYLRKVEFEKVMHSKSSREAKRRLSKWIVLTQNSGIKEYQPCCSTFIKWANEITESLDHNITNGYTEGVNNKIKVLKRVSFGVKNFSRFRNRILHMMASQ